MAARKQQWNPDWVRAKIQASLLVKRLEDHALSNNELMTSSQIQAANILLKKSISDLTSTEITGNADKPIQHKLRIEFVRAGE